MRVPLIRKSFQRVLCSNIRMCQKGSSLVCLLSRCCRFSFLFTWFLLPTTSSILKPHFSIEETRGNFHDWEEKNKQESPRSKRDSHCWMPKMCARVVSLSFSPFHFFILYVYSAFLEVEKTRFVSSFFHPLCFHRNQTAVITGRKKHNNNWISNLYTSFTHTKQRNMTIPIF